ncbi:snare associated Golgi protein-domain-containing protein [Thelephora terrestris]|uniref:Golgi apparatus membrane protein TVP38 n=1 Tax=Thelephora terrestris TaxID=56493 RepID=A0A9P6HM67_9AGAM|nr:snare associated Golgi protein-domain-containing protein [Thelephora terrestris]
MNNERYPPSSQIYPSNRVFSPYPGSSALPTSPVTLQAATVWNTDTKLCRSLGTRTPSPTPSEAAELSRAGAFDWQRFSQWRFWFRREWLWYYVVLALICIVATLVTLYHQEIVDFLRPAANWMHEFPAGFVIPIAILFIISFPPLFGHEIVAILCGLVWGLWLGFAIVCAGTFLGEVGNFYAFKYCCRSRGEKLEKTNIAYGCLAKVVRNGDFTVALIARLSAIPGHFTTAVFSTCGMDIVVFSLAAFLSLPKQFVTVYLGVALEQAANGEKTSTRDQVLKYSIIVVTLIITVWAMWYIYAQMSKVKAQVIYERRKARQVTTIGLGDDSDDVPSRGVGVGRSEHPSFEASEDSFQLAAGGGRDTLSNGGNFTTRKYHHTSRSTGPRMHQREELVNPFEPRQHLRTRSLSAFHRDTT